MGNSKALLLTRLLLLVSTALVSSTGTCPAEVVFKVDPCSSFINSVIHSGSGGGGFPSSAECCNVVNKLDSKQAADCLCFILKRDFSGDKDVKIDPTLAFVFNVCKKQEPAGYKCA